MSMLSHRLSTMLLAEGMAFLGQKFDRPGCVAGSSVVGCEAFATTVQHHPDALVFSLRISLGLRMVSACATSAWIAWHQLNQRSLKDSLMGPRVVQRPDGSPLG